uniref:Uncharacterized protein n=1 Tax=Heterorhabditis bacteriophora TaxID=37862 RepID=A0A1I7XQG8_HETBA
MNRLNYPVAWLVLGNKHHQRLMHKLIKNEEEYLNENSNFTVIAAIGPQGAGKSTLLICFCQATNCAAILDEALRYSRSSKLDDRQDVANHVEVHYTTYFLHIIRSY